jgi:hypothetical protein
MKNIAVPAVFLVVGLFAFTQSSLFGNTPAPSSSQALEVNGVGQVNDSGKSDANGSAVVPTKNTDSEKPVQTTVVASDETPIALGAVVAGAEVKVQSVTLPVSGWVAIHDYRAGAANSIGNVLGAAWFPAGIHENISVELLRATVAGQKYFAVLHADDGDKIFEIKADPILLSNPSTNIPFAAEFTAQAN